MPDDDLTLDDETFTAVREQLRAAWRRANPTLPDDQMPAAITFAEGDLPDSCFAYVPSGEPKSARKLKLCNDAGDLDAGIIGAAAAALGKGFRGRKVQIPADDRPGVVRKVRAAWRKANPDKDDDEMPDVLKASETAVFHDDPWYAPPKLPKADERVTYRLASEDAGPEEPKETCYRCRYYGYGSCALVEGGIEAAYVCDLFTLPLLTAPAAMFAVRDEGPVTDGPASKLHVYQPLPAAMFADPPEWSPFLPVPGRYDHPVYGELDFSPEVYDRIIANFKSGIYQERIPVNAEHDPHAAGSIGWITDMRLADSGAIEARVEWNDRGKALIEDDRYRYVSAEVMPVWTDPVEPDKEYRDVAVGLALTTHPYFKERVLPPLAASEAVLTRHAGEPGKEVLMAEDKTQQQTPPAAEPAVQLTEAEIAAFRQFQEAGGAATFAELKTRAEAAEGRVGALETDARRKRFTDVVLGKAEGSDGARWFGEPDKHVAHLIKLAETFGEDSEEVAHYVTVNTAHAEQLKRSDLFREIGTGRGDELLTALDKLNAKATEHAEKTGKTFAVAFTEVLASERDLARQYAAERR